jgi:hypothetical protein
MDAYAGVCTTPTMSDVHFKRARDLATPSKGTLAAGPNIRPNCWLGFAELLR